MEILSVTKEDTYAVLNVDGKGTIPLIELTCKSEILAIILLNVDAKRISYDDTIGSRPFMLLTFNASVASVLNEDTMGANPLILLTRKSFT